MNKLNTNQQIAVDNIDGPVMVLAGPGTGKTQVLSDRIIKIIEETDTSPYNILCLTFTDAGVVAMKKRLLENLGPMAHHLNIYTFHSFCTRVIYENPDLIGFKDLEAADQIDITLIIREIIDSLPKGHNLRRVSVNPYFDEKALADLFQTLKMEDMTSLNDLTQKTTEYIKDLPNKPEFQYKRKYKTFNAGDPKPALIKDETDKMLRLLSAAELLPKYDQMLRQKKLYDFADMLIYVSKAFDRYEWLLRRYQEQFLYVLVDEFQDTNGMQFKLINQLLSFWEEQANIFTVGDDDQCLYQFQGARLENLVQFENQYPDIVKVNLDVNYRSNQNIINAATNVISNNTERLSQDKEFKAHSKEIKNVECFQYESLEDEYTDAISYAQQRLDKGDSVAIIYSKHRQVEPIVNALEAMGAPYTTKKRKDGLNDPIIDCVISLLIYFNDPIRYDAVLYGILNYPFMDITPFEAAELFQSKRVHNAIEGNEHKILLQFIESSEVRIKEFIEYGINYAPISSPFTFYKWVVHNSGMLHYFKDQDYALSVLKTFADFIENQQSKNPRLTIKKLINIIIALQENKIAMPVQSIVANGGINLLSAHGSKGLEFDTVIMIDCTKTWEPGRGGSKFKFPDNITLSGEEASLEFSRRAFYVAMTRAKSRLRMSYSAKHGDKDKNPSQFISESEVEITKASTSSDKIRNFVQNSLQGLSTINAADINDQYIAENLEDFTLSFSAMSTYQRCPISFYYQYVLKVPIIEKSHLEFGNAVHSGLEMFYRDMLRNKKKFGSKLDVIKYFKEYMTSNEFKFSSVDYPRYVDRGEEALNSYIKEIELSTTVRVEQHISNCEIEGVPVKGIIDLLSFTSDIDVDITDYKTGKYKKENYAEGDSENIGGKHWRQANFYFALLFAQSKENWVPKSCTFSYVEPTDKGHKNVTIENDSQGLHIIRNQIKQTYKSIQNQEFSTGCGEENCQWCNLQNIKNL